MSKLYTENDMKHAYLFGQGQFGLGEPLDITWDTWLAKRGLPQDSPRGTLIKTKGTRVRIKGAK